ncbi:MAG TPA: hypothetical protein VIL95_09060 [Bacillota bacterium]
MRWRHWARAVGRGSTIAILLLSTVFHAAAWAAQSHEPAVPVILVHGFQEAGPTWGLPPHRSGLYDHLRRLGYRPGRTLFWSTAPVWRDPIEAARQHLIPLLERIGRQTGARQVDLVVHGSGALDLLALQADLRGNPPLARRLPVIRRVVAIAPLWRGHDGARIARQTAFQIALLNWHRTQGLGRNVELSDHPPELEPGATPFRSELDYVLKRAYTVYEPLYHAFLRQAWFVHPSGPGTVPDALPAPSFWDWLDRSQPGRSERWLSETAPAPAARPDWPAGADLSRAEYEVAALAAARFAYRSLQPVADVALEGWERDLDLGGDLREALGRFLARRVWHVLTRMGPVWAEEARDRLLEQLLERSTGVDVLATPLRRLVPLTAAADEGLPTERVTNLWLAAMLGQPPAGAAQGPELVEVVGRLDGPLAALVRWWLGPTGGEQADKPALEGVRSWRRVQVRGWWGVDAASLPSHPAAQRVVAETLLAPLDAGEDAAGTAASPAPAANPATREAGGGTDGTIAQGDQGELPLIRVVRHSKQTSRYAGEAVASGSPAPATGADAVPPPQVDLTLSGPVLWIVGRPARFAVSAQIVLPPGAELVEQRYDPGELFEVLWERPGDDFQVTAALVLTVRHRLPDGHTPIRRYVYTVTRTVDVLAIGADGHR